MPNVRKYSDTYVLKLMPNVRKHSDTYVLNCHNATYYLITNLSNSES